MRVSKNVNVNDLINDYVKNGFGIEYLCSKYHIGKLKVKDYLRANNIEIKKRGNQKIDDSEFIVKDYNIEKYHACNGFHYEVYDSKTNFRTTDLKNKSGVLTTYIEKQYGVLTPSLYDRNMFYKRTGNYWWEQWLSVELVKNPDVKKCPYCNWETTDINNNSGAFSIHIFKKHGLTKNDHLLNYPEDKQYFSMVSPTQNLQMETDENEFVKCKVCGKKLRRITDIHLKKHEMTKNEYMEKYSLTSTTCNALHNILSNITIESNINRERNFSSSQEKEIKDYIESFGIECKSDRKILKGQELDIFIPSKNIAIEFNGNLWHSERFKKDKNYHLNKLNTCNEKGIKLLQIFEDEYAYNKDIVLSKIKHILKLENNDSIKIAGRKCIVNNIDKTTAKKFLDKNHIQGFSNSSVYIGAYYNEELIAVMSFLNENNDEWNLTRFASLNGYICQGVASKVFSYFIKKYSPYKVKSFADRRWTLDSNNNLYTKLGFNLNEVLKPDYRYYNSKVDRYKRFHKFNFRKQRLHKKYGFPLSMTEKEMTEKLGYERIWDCGLFKYVWTNTNTILVTEQVMVDNIKQSES